MSGTPPAKIFIVDDDPGLLRLVEISLKREGFITPQPVQAMQRLLGSAKTPRI
jgi:DNA-binding response OmpR family regulator